MRTTFRQLAVFAEIARGENVSRAAEALNLSQSATRAVLADLERLFDVRLFLEGVRRRQQPQGLRHPRHVGLTVTKVKFDPKL